MNEVTSTYPPATVFFASAALLLAAGLIRRAGPQHTAAGPGIVALGVAVHALLVCALFAEALLRGWALAPPLLLLNTWPWAAYHFDTPPRAPNPMTIDLALQFGPWLEHIRTQILQGTLPLWNSLSGPGEPFVALYQSAVFSPFTLAGALARPPYGLLVIGVLQLLAGGLGMLLLLRAVGLALPAMVIGSTAWLFNSFTIGWLAWPFASASCLLPWLLWAVHGAIATPDRRRFALLAAICGVVLLSGHPEIAFKMGLVVVAVGLAGAAAAQQRRGAALRLLAGAALSGLLLAAAQIGPFLEYLPQTGKLEQRRGTVNASYTPRKAMVVALAPDFFGPPTGPWRVVSNSEGTPTNYLAQLVYPGVAIWLLAAVGVVSCWRHWGVKALTVAGVAAAAFTYGAPGFLQLVRHLPTPLPYFSVDIVFCAVALGAWGFDALWRAGKKRGADALATPGASIRLWPAVLAASVAVAVIGVSLIRERAILQQMGLWPGTLRASTTAVVFVVVTLALIVARRQGWLNPAAFAVLLFGCLVVDLVGFSRSYQRLAPPELVYPRVPEIDTITRDPGLFRVVGLDDTLQPNSHLPFGFASVRTYDGVGGPRRFNMLIDRALGVRADLVNMPPSRSPSHAALDLLNVKYVVGPPDLELPAPSYERLHVGRAALYRNVDVLPRAFLAGRYLVQPNDARAAEALVDGTIDGRRTVVLPEDIPLSHQPRPEGAEGDIVAVRHYRSDFVEIETSSAARRLLVLTDLYADGWSATVDDNEAPLFRADVAFRAVPVPAGKHVVRFRYAPRAFRLGAWVSVLTALALAGVAASSVRRRPRTSPTSPSSI